MSDVEAYERFRDLQRYMGWTCDDERRIGRIAGAALQHADLLVDDFYAQIEKHSDAARVITGGDAQIQRLKQSLAQWLRELFTGPYDREYVTRRWLIGSRHASIGLHPVLAGAALGRMRNQLVAALFASGQEPPHAMGQTIESVNKLFDLDQLIIADAYEAEHLRREREAERERGEVRFRALVEAAACMVVILRANCEIAYFSPYASKMSGFDPDFASGRSFTETLVAPEMRGEFVDEISQTLQRRPARHSETSIVCADGRRRWIAWNAQCLDDYLGESALVLVGHDCTERREAHERSLRAERLAGIGQMIAGLAHESRNALQRIQSCSEMLELEVAESPEALRWVQRVQEAQDTLKRLFEEVRGYSAPISLETAPTDVKSCWRAAWDELDTVRRGRDAKINEQCDQVDTTASADPFRIVQVFRNLLENSLAAASDPVEISISAAPAAMGDREALQLTIQDNGPGLPKGVDEAVFEPFFTTKTKGTGLGMAIARRLVDAHGGTIVIGDRSRVGATFVITLPR